MTDEKQHVEPSSSSPAPANLEMSEPVLVDTTNEKTSSSPQLSSKNAGKLHRIMAILQHKDRLANSNKYIITSGDTNLAVIGYPSLVVSAVVQFVAESKSIRHVLDKWARRLPGDSRLKSVLSDPARLADRFKAIYNHTSDLRAFLRMWASLDYIEWAVASFNDPPHDWVLRYVDYAQLFACIWYQLLENVAYLASHQLLHMSSNAEGWLWCVSCLCWAAHVQLDFVKMFRQRHLQQGKVDANWWQGLAVNCCFAPLSIHWSFEQGCLPDLVVGVLGSYYTFASAYPKWKSILF